MFRQRGTLVLALIAMLFLVFMSETYKLSSTVFAMDNLTPTVSNIVFPHTVITIKNVSNLRLKIQLSRSGLHPVWSSNGKWLASIDGKDILLYDAGDLGTQPKILHTDISADTVVFSPDGSTLAFGNLSGIAEMSSTVEIWDIFKKQKFTTLQHVYRPTFSRDGRSLYLDDYANLSTLVWDIKANKYRTRLKETRDPVFSPDGSVVASLGTLSNVGTIHLWKSNTDDLLFALKGHKTYASSVIFSADGTKLASASEDGVVKLWNVATGQLLTTISTDCANYVAFSPDTSYLLFWSQDCGEENNIQWWNINNPTYQVNGTKDKFVRSIDFSRDGSVLIVEVYMEDYYETRFLDFTTGEEQIVLQTAMEPQLNPDGTLLATTSADNGIVQIWSVN